MKLKVGTIIGQLTLLEKEIRIMPNGKKRTYWRCQCSCGNTKSIRSDSLLSGNIKSCGCYNKEVNYKKTKDITNKRFGRLIALEPTKERSKYNGSVIWKCKCDCGNIAYVAEYRLLKEEIQSCGCIKEENSIKNGKLMGALTKECCVEGTNVRNLTMKLSKRNTSGIKGVSWCSSRKKWLAQIKFKGKAYYLGRYEKKEDAAAIRKVAEEKLFGEFLEWYTANMQGRKEKNEKR